MRIYGASLLFACLLALGTVPGANANVVTEDTLLWMSSYNDVKNHDDKAFAVSVDSGGNIYVAGTENRSDRNEDYNILVNKYSPAGDLLWSRSAQGIPDGEDMAFGVAAIPDGGAYVTGWVTQIGGLAHAWIGKYGSNGEVLGTTTYEQAGSNESYFFSVALDNAGKRVYAAGMSNDTYSGFGSRWLVVQYDLDLNRKWVRHYEGTAWYFNEAYAVAVASDGGVLVAGYETRADSNDLLYTDVLGRRKVLRDSGSYLNTDAVLLKYESSGTLAWSSRYGSDVNDGQERQDAYYGVAVDGDGFIYAVGVAEPDQPSNSKTDRLIRKYTPDGRNVQWTRNVAVMTNQDDGAEACAVVRPGKLVVAGSSLSSDFGWDAYIESYETVNGGMTHRDWYDSGNYLSKKNEDWLTGVAACGAGSYVAVGYENRNYDLMQSYNWFIRKYSGPVPVPVTLLNTRVFPNPFNPATAVGGTLKFAPLPSSTTVRIYTVRGYLVREICERGNEATWDGTNGRGDRAGSGVYVYVVSAPGLPAIRGRFMLSRQ